MTPVTNPCSIAGCDRPAINIRGWCKRHYLRWWRHGDPLKRTRFNNDGEADAYFRDVVMAYEGDDCIRWPFQNTRPMLRRNGKHSFVSRLVCIEHRGPPPSPVHQAAHSCKNGDFCITKAHLSWKTPKENSADKNIHGTMARGERHGRWKGN
jgi:hypothetical protein